MGSDNFGRKSPEEEELDRQGGRSVQDAMRSLGFDLFEVDVLECPRQWASCGVFPGAKLWARNGREPRTYPNGARRRSLHIGSVLLFDEKSEQICDSKGAPIRLLDGEWKKATGV